MRNTGIAFTAVAVAHLVAGIVTIAVAQTPSEQFCPAGCDNAPGVFVSIAGIFVVVSSVVYAGIGVPLWVVGARPAPAPSAALAGEPSRPRVSIEPSARGLRLAF
jgi:hypothetical protein